MKKRSKRYKKIVQKKITEPKAVNDVVSLVKNTSTAKFDESIDVSFKLNLKQSKQELNLRTVVNLPNGSGKKIRVAVICEENKIQEAKSSGADLYGEDNIIKDISEGKMNFDKLISTPGLMIKVSKLGKILGPKGLMPNPKLGTVTNDISKAVKLLKTGQVEIKNDKDGNLLTTIGKKSFTNDHLLQNFNAVLDKIIKEKPAGSKGKFILSSFLTSTMGISYKLKLQGI